MLDQEEVSRALRIFEQRISTPEFEEWVKPIYDGAKHPHFFFGLGNCSSEDSRVADACLCVSTSPTTFSEEDVTKCFIAVPCKGVHLYTENIAERNKIRRQQFEIIERRLKELGMDCSRWETGYLFEAVCIFKDGCATLEMF
jgi:hypothetical protein